MTLRIRRWQGRHEVSQSRKVRGPLEWVSVPTRQGRGYCKLVAEHGAAGLGVWLALLELSAAQPHDERGTIPGSLEDAAMLSRLATSEVVAVSQTLIAIGWLEVENEEQNPSKPATDSPATSALPERSHDAPYTGQDRTGQKKDMSPGGDLSRPDSNGKDTEPWGRGFTETPEGQPDIVHPPGLAYLWNAIAAQHGCPRVTAFPERRRRSAGLRAKEEPDPMVWSRAFRAMCEDAFLSGKNDRHKTYATFDYAMSSKGDRWLDEARTADEELIP